MNKKLILCIVLVILLGISMIMSMVYTWAKQDTTKLLLFWCEDCPSFTSYEWSWECFAQYYCESSGFGEFCDAYNRAYEIVALFQCCEAFSLLFLMLLLEKLIILGLHKDFGHICLFYVYTVLMCLLHCLGIVAWFSLVNLDYSDCPAPESDEEPVFCVETGPMIAFANGIAAIGISILLILVVSRRDVKKDRSYFGAFDGKMCCCSVRFMMLLSFFSIIFGCGGVLIGSSSKEAIERTASDLEFTGGISRCQDCNDDYEDFGYSCLAGLACNTSSDSGECDLYKRLDTAMRYYILVQIVGGLALCLLLQTLGANLANRDYGISCLNYIYAFVLGASQIAAIIIWFLNSEITYDDCDTETSDPEDTLDICPKFNFFLLLLGCFLIFIGCLLYIVSYCKRRKSSLRVYATIHNKRGNRTPMPSMDVSVHEIKT